MTLMKEKKWFCWVTHYLNLTKTTTFRVGFCPSIKPTGKFIKALKIRDSDFYLTRVIEEPYSPLPPHKSFVD
jgi:hypothetical protein